VKRTWTGPAGGARRGTVPSIVASVLREHAPHNAMGDPDEIARFHDRCSDLMRELLHALADAPDRPRPFPAIEDAMGWPRRRVAAVLGGVGRLRQIEFAGRRPYRFLDARTSASGRWEMWMDAGQAEAVRSATAAYASRTSIPSPRASSGPSATSWTGSMIAPRRAVTSPAGSSSEPRKSTAVSRASSSATRSSRQ